MPLTLWQYVVIALLLLVPYQVYIYWQAYEGDKALSQNGVKDLIHTPIIQEKNLVALADSFEVKLNKHSFSLCIKLSKDLTSSLGYINAAFSIVNEDPRGDDVMQSNGYNQHQLGFDKDLCVRMPEEIWIGGEDHGTIELSLRHCLNYFPEQGIECDNASDTWDYWRDL